MTTKEYDPQKNLLRMMGGNMYLPVADRIIMAVKTCEREGKEISVSSEIIHLDPDNEFVVVRSTVAIPGYGTGCGLKSQWGLKYKTKKEGGFPAYIEKAHTGSLGRALAQIGFGTEAAYEFREEDAQEGDGPDNAVDTPRPAPIAAAVAQELTLHQQLEQMLKAAKTEADLKKAAAQVSSAKAQRLLDQVTLDDLAKVYAARQKELASA